MSEENVEVVRRGFKAYGRRDIAGFLSFLDPNFELHSAIVGGAEGKIYRGHDGAREWLADSDEAFDELTIEPTEFRDLGNRVVVLGQIRARGWESAVEIDSPTGWVYELENGKLTKAQGFLSFGEALEAAGLSE